MRWPAPPGSASTCHPGTLVRLSVARVAEVRRKTNPVASQVRAGTVYRVAVKHQDISNPHGRSGPPSGRLRIRNPILEMWLNSFPVRSLYHRERPKSQRTIAERNPHGPDPRRLAKKESILMRWSRGIRGARRHDPANVAALAINGRSKDTSERV